MERIINLHIEKLPEGVYLATSDDIQGLIAQGRTISETMEIAKDVARRLLESQEEKNHTPEVFTMGNSFDCSLVVAMRSGTTYNVALCDIALHFAPASQLIPAPALSFPPMAERKGGIECGFSRRDPVFFSLPHSSWERKI